MIVPLLSIVIFMQILFRRIYAEDTFDCTGYEDDSFHPMYNVNNCRYYWHCIYVDTVYMRAIKRICPAGTEFDVQLKECEISSLVNCTPLKSSHTSRTSTKKYSKLFPQKQRITTQKRPFVDVDVTTTTIPPQYKVLPITTSRLTPILLIENFLKSLMALKQESAAYTIESEISNTTNHTFQSESPLFQTTTETPPTTTMTDFFLTSKFKPRHLGRHRRRNNLTLYVFTSNEHKIRQFPINQTHGLLIQCNEIRRRQLRDLIFRTTKNPMKIGNSSSKILHYDIFTLTILIISFLFLQK